MLARGVELTAKAGAGAAFSTWSANPHSSQEQVISAYTAKHGSSTTQDDA